MAWYDYPVTQAHGVSGEQGIDIGTPFHTPITAIDPGTVDKTMFGPFGGLIEVLTGRGNEYYLHEDAIDVAKGQQVAAGQELGLSGGQLAGGAHPAQPAFSSGPHTEFDVFSGKAWASPSTSSLRVTTRRPRSRRRHGAGRCRSRPSSCGMRCTSSTSR